MILMFNKINHEGKCFRNWECKPVDDTTGYTEKVPPHAGVCWNEESGEWILRTGSPEEPPA